MDSRQPVNQSSVVGSLGCASKRVCVIELIVVSEPLPRLLVLLLYQWETNAGIKEEAGRHYKDCNRWTGSSSSGILRETTVRSVCQPPPLLLLQLLLLPLLCLIRALLLLLPIRMKPTERSDAARNDGSHASGKTSPSNALGRLALSIYHSLHRSLLLMAQSDSPLDAVLD